MKTIYKMREQFMDTTLSKVLIHFLKVIKSDDALSKTCNFAITLVTLRVEPNLLKSHLP